MNGNFADAAAGARNANYNCDGFDDLTYSSKFRDGEDRVMTSLLNQPLCRRVPREFYLYRIGGHKLATISGARGDPHRRLGVYRSASKPPIVGQEHKSMAKHEAERKAPKAAEASCVDIQRISLESAIRHTAEAIVITSATGRIQYVNPAFSQMTGYEPSEVIGQLPSVLKSEKQDPAYYERLWKTITAGKVWRGELINRRKDGTNYTEEMSITPVLNSLGRPSNFIAIKQDVTERRAAEAAQQFLAAIVESSDDAVVGSTLDGKIITWNRGAEKLHGYRKDEVAGQPITILLAREYRDQTGRVLEGLVRGKVFPRLESVCVHKDGTRIPVSLTVSLVRTADGTPTGLSAIIRDMTRAQQADKALRDSEARFRAVFEQTPYSLFVSTADSRILQANAAFCHMLGYQPNEVVSLGWFRITHEDDRERSMQAYQQLLEDRKTHLAMDVRLLRKDARAIAVRVKMSVVEVDGACQFVSHVEELGQVVVR
jgi:PAS domain S-box-containing protein